MFCILTEEWNSAPKMIKRKIKFRLILQLRFNFLLYVQFFASLLIRELSLDVNTGLCKIELNSKFSLARSEVAASEIKASWQFKIDINWSLIG